MVTSNKFISRKSFNSQGLTIKLPLQKMLLLFMTSPTVLEQHTRPLIFPKSQVNSYNIKH